MEFKNTQQVLKIIGELIVEQYKNDLKTNPKKYGNGRNSIASGKLFNSVQYKLNIDENLKLYLTLDDHYIYVEEGSKFTNKYPPISVIRKWMIDRGIGGKNLDYKIQRSIFKKGIKPKPYLRDIKETLRKNYKDEIEQALKKDIKEFLKNKINETKNKLK